VPPLEPLEPLELEPDDVVFDVLDPPLVVVVVLPFVYPWLRSTIGRSTVAEPDPPPPPVPGVLMITTTGRDGE
jgi:hypothetical protein